MNRLSSAVGGVANDVDATIIVLSENEVAIELKTGTTEKPEPVKGVQVKARDTPKGFQTEQLHHQRQWRRRNPGKYVQHGRIGDPPYVCRGESPPQGYRDFIIEYMDLAKGESYKLFLTPMPKARRSSARRLPSPCATGSIPAITATCHCTWRLSLPR